MSDNGAAGPEAWAALGIIVTAVGGVVTAMVTKVRPKGGPRADYADRLVNASVTLVEQLQEEIDGWRAEAHSCQEALTNLQDRLNAQQHRYDSMVRYLRSVGLEVPEGDA
jgi:hypothetical protein